MSGQLAVHGGAPVCDRPWPHWPIRRPGARRALIDAFDSGRWTISAPGGGTAEPDFGQAFAAYCEAATAVPTANGSAALTIALAAAGGGHGDEVLVPAISWVACAAAVLSLGAVPVAVDVRADDLCMSIDAAAYACGARTSAVLLVHQNCWIANVDAFASLCRDRDLALIEDCSHAHGARRRGRRVGTFGEAAGFSLQQSKLLACGEGGVAVSSDESVGHRLHRLRANGRRYDEQAQALVELPDLMGDNLLMSEFHAAIASENLTHLDEENRARLAAARQLSLGLAEVAGVQPPGHPPDDEPTFHKYTVALDIEAFAGRPINVIAAAVSRELGAPCELLDAPLGRNPLYNPGSSPRSKGRSIAVPTSEDHPVALAAVERCLAFRHHLLLADRRQLEMIVEAIAKVQRHAGALSAPDLSLVANP